MNKFILAIDQGTSSTKTLILNDRGQVVARGSDPLNTMYMKDGFVEQKPESIFNSVIGSIHKCLAEFIKLGFDLGDIKSCGISNQRETFIVWDRSGNPLYNAVVWQCKRSIQICQRLVGAGFSDEIRFKTGLVLDPYFSGTKLIWLYENAEKVQYAIDQGNALFGTVDTWILYKLTNAKSYCTDHTNASRTLFFNLNTLEWDRDILHRWGLNHLQLPQVKASSADYGTIEYEEIPALKGLPIHAMIGDSQSAAFGEYCFDAGTAKATLGTGCSILMNIGNKPKISKHGMLTTICWSFRDRVDYALEGAIVSCGSTLEWLKNELGILSDSRESELMANAITDNNGVYIIPAFSGLGAPHWDMNRKASIVGLTFNSNKKHIVRAALESIAYQIKDVITAMEQDANLKLQNLFADGGITSNSFVMQFTADLLKIPVSNMNIADVSALGVGYLAGLCSGIFYDLNSLKLLQRQHKVYSPNLENGHSMDEYYSTWLSLVK